MGVLLLCRSPFELRLLQAEGFDLDGREDLIGGGRPGAVAGADELGDAGRRVGGEEGEFDEGLSTLDLAGLDIEALALEDPEQLLDVPALAIPLDDLQSVLWGLDGMGGQQPPMQRRLLARARAAFANVDDMDNHAVRQCSAQRRAMQPRGAPQFDLAEAHLHLGPTLWAARLPGHGKLVTQYGRQPTACGEQRIATDQRAVLCGSGQQMQVGRTWPGPALVNVGLAVVDHRYQFGRP